MYNTI